MVVKLKYYGMTESRSGDGDSRLDAGLFPRVKRSWCFRRLLFSLWSITSSNMATETLENSQPSLYNYVLGFLAVGLAWGFTTPFMRKAAMTSQPISRPQLEDPNSSFLTKKVLSIWYAVYDLVARPAYSIPLLLNLSGSVWFFLLVGQAGMLISRMLRDQVLIYQN